MSRSKSLALPLVLALVLLAVTALVCAYASMKYSAIVEATERDNLAFTRRIAAELGADVEAIVAAFSSASPESIRRAPETTAFRGRLLRFIREKNVVKVKIYALSGSAIFSSDVSQIGGGVSPGVDLLAITRLENQFSKLEFRDKFVGFDNVARDRYVVSSYVPVFGPGGRASAVLEIYSDVTARDQRAVWIRRAAGLLILLSLVTVGIGIFLILRRVGRHPGPSAQAAVPSPI